ncbi:HD domain-containing protein [Sphaerochaeta sp.]|uniref:HD domain-containing protein n=1 Tax=Sphaerochaeta sp. TaxID=1972642 RepID=UPI002FC79736
MQTSNAQLLYSLYSEQQTSIRDPLWKDIQLSHSMKQILLTPAVQKLGRIKQLGPTFHLYPGAVHTRLDHSLGVYHVSFLMLASLLKQAMQTNEQVPFTKEGMRTFLCASLLHDIGHFPFAHSLKELALQDHEHIAASLILENDRLRAAIAKAQLDPYLVAAVIDDQLSCEQEEILFYRRLLSGTLDPDKLDYLNRDAFFCGVPYGTQDVSYITDKLTIHQGNLALEEQALGSVEHLLFSKYLMYRNVYWHRTTRSATAMIKKAILTDLGDGMLEPQELYALDDEQFFLLPEKKTLHAHALLEAVRDNQLYRCVYEKPYEAEGVWEKQTNDLTNRSETETQLAERLGIESLQLVIDIPEPIGFEADLPILGEDGSLSSFSALDHIFSYDIGMVFTKSLRKFRIFSPAFLSETEIKAALEF